MNLKPREHQTSATNNRKEKKDSVPRLSYGSHEIGVKSRNKAMTGLNFAVFAFAVVAISHIISPVTGTAKGALKVSVAKAFCTFVKTAKQAGNTLGTQLPKIKTAIESAEKTRLQNELAAMKLPQHRDAALITATYATQALSENLQALSAWTKTETDTLAQAVFSAGAIDSFLRHLDQHRSTTPSDNKNCIGKDEDGNYENYDLDKECGDMELSKTEAGATDVQATISTAFAGIGQPEANGGSKDCLLFSDVSAAYSNKGNGLEYLQGLIKVGTNSGLTGATSIGAQKNENKLIKAIEQHWTTTEKALNHPTITTPTNLQAFKALLKTQATRVALKAAATDYATWKTDKLPEPLDSYLKKAYGIQTDGEEGTYLTALKSLEATVRGNPGETTSKPIFSMTVTELQEAIAAEIVTIGDRYAKITKEIDTLRQNQGKEASEDTCNKKGQNECKSPCKWKENATDANKKCTLSEEANKEVEGKKEDGKTNTTGSNSFVINKAPLLLAFLFF